MPTVYNKLRKKTWKMWVHKSYKTKQNMGTTKQSRMAIAALFWVVIKLFFFSMWGRYFMVQVAMTVNRLSLRLRQNSRLFSDDIFTCMILTEDVWILISISLKFVASGSFDNNPALVQILAWHYLNQWWLDYRHIYASLGLKELRQFPTTHLKIRHP